MTFPEPIKSPDLPLLEFTEYREKPRDIYVMKFDGAIDTATSILNWLIQFTPVDRFSYDYEVVQENNVVPASIRFDLPRYFQMYLPKDGYIGWDLKQEKVVTFSTEEELLTYFDKK